MDQNILFEALGSLLGGIVRKNKTSFSLVLTYQNYSVFSLSFGSFGILGKNKSNLSDHNESFKILREKDDELIKKERCKEIYIPDDLLDPLYDFDFTDINDFGREFYRGGLAYKRPCGWKRYALKVSDKYEDNKWLRCTIPMMIQNGQFPIMVPKLQMHS